jgi:hypothetical protein
VLKVNKERNFVNLVSEEDIDDVKAEIFEISNDYL